MKSIVRSVGVLLLAVAAWGAQAAPQFYNGHYYDYIFNTSGNFTQDEALSDAATRTFLGMTGYVATVTSRGENDFIHGFVTESTAWLGGNDRGSEGAFRWVNGPEAGQLFSFNFWSAGEPNNCCNGEDDVVINWGVDGSWNDIGLPSFPDYRLGYIIEFDANQNVPEPGSVALLGLGLAALGWRRRK